MYLIEAIYITQNASGSHSVVWTDGKDCQGIEVASATEAIKFCQPMKTFGRIKEDV